MGCAQNPVENLKKRVGEKALKQKHPKRMDKTTEIICNKKTGGNLWVVNRAKAGETAQFR